MIQQIVILSLIITAIHACTWDGMILAKPREWLGDLLDKWNISVLRKPLFECLTCMGGIYSIIIYPILFGWSWYIIPVALGVIGLNTIISILIAKVYE